MLLSDCNMDAILEAINRYFPNRYFPNLGASDNVVDEPEHRPDKTTLNRPTPFDSWEAIEAQLDHWAALDRKYWEQRKEREYTAWLERAYRV